MWNKLDRLARCDFPQRDGTKRKNNAKVAPSQTFPGAGRLNSPQVAACDHDVCKQDGTWTAMINIAKAVRVVIHVTV